VSTPLGNASWSEQADVQRIAATYLDPKTMTLVVVGDRKQVDAQLKPWVNPAKPNTSK
jgi:hypothetical protein